MIQHFTQYMLVYCYSIYALRFIITNTLALEYCVLVKRTAKDLISGEGILLWDPCDL